MDLANMIAQMPSSTRPSAKIGVFTDPNVAKLDVMKVVEQSLQASNLNYVVWDQCAVEPTDKSWNVSVNPLCIPSNERQDAIAFARSQDITHFLAVGGGSSMDTAKAANLFVCYPEADLMEFINAPIGKGRPVDKSLRPLIASESIQRSAMLIK